MAKLRDGLQVTFSKATLRRLADGTARLMGNKAVVVNSQTGQVEEIGTLIGGVGRVAASWPFLLSGGMAVAAAAVQQQQLGTALKALDAGIKRW